MPLKMYALRFINGVSDSYSHPSYWGKLARIDWDSGGYSSAVEDCYLATFFKTAESALEHSKHFRNILEVVEIEMQIKKIEKI